MTVESLASSDLTPLFKSCTKTIRTRNKALGVTLPQTKIFPNSPTPFSQFFSRAKDVMSNIISHQNLLMDHAKNYQQDSEQAMSDYDRSYMEKVVSTNMHIIEDTIRSLISEIPDQPQNSGGTGEYQQVIVSILKMKFQDINSTFKQMKELRKKNLKEKDRLYRLQRPVSIRKRVNSSSSGSNPSIPDLTQHDKEKGDSSDPLVDGSSSKEYTQKRKVGEGQGPDEVKREGASEGDVSHMSSFLDFEMEELLGDISHEERQVLEQENAHLYKELRSNQEEVRQITKQVVELVHMQDILSENVELQAHQIEEIQETIISSTENIREGNEQVREAMRKDAGFRVWIMFFLIVMSCTILFLDWYQ